MRTKGKTFRGTTSIRHPYPASALCSPAGWWLTTNRSRLRDNGLTRAVLLFSAQEFLQHHTRATFGAAPLRRLSAGGRSFSGQCATRLLLPENCIYYFQVVEPDYTLVFVFEDQACAARQPFKMANNINNM